MSEGLIYKKIALCMKEIEAVSKDRKNDQQNYKFRGVDDVYNELHSILAKHGVFTVPEVLDERTEERQTAKGYNLIYRVLKIKYTFYAEDGSNVIAIVIGEGMDSGDKATNKAMSVAHKYSLLQVFCIPTKDDKDPEIDSPQVKPKERDITKELKAETRQKAFDKNNPRAMEWLQDVLEDAKPTIPLDSFTAIAERFNGKYKVELPKIVREITGIEPRWDVQH